MEQVLHKEIEVVSLELANVGKMVRYALAKALTALRNGDKRLAKEVREGDDEVDKLEVACEERLLSLLALYQPVARDLRFLVTALKVNNELEHIGDFAESIAAKVKKLDSQSVFQTEMNIFGMGEKVEHMIELAMDSFLQQDSSLARQVVDMDDAVDKIHGYNHRVIRDCIEDETKIFQEDELQLLSISRSLERIADTAASIAQDVVYYVDGQIIRHRSRA